MSVPLPVSAPEKKTVPRPGWGRLWGIVDLVLLLAVASGAAFYVVKETFLRHDVQIVDRPVGPLTQFHDASGAAAAAPTPAPSDAPPLPAPAVSGAGDVPVKVESAQ